MSDPLNLTATIGGRLVAPALPTVDSSPSPPSELLFDESLTAYISHNVPLESTEGIQRRERVLMKMASLCREWVKSVARKRGWGDDMVDRAGGELFTSGSYRLGVHEPGADIGELRGGIVCLHRWFAAVMSCTPCVSIVAVLECIRCDLVVKLRCWVL